MRNKIVLSALILTAVIISGCVCLDGQCGTCVDTDRVAGGDGINYDVKGQVKTADDQNVDTCYRTDQGAIYSCSGPNCAIQEFYCGVDKSIWYDINFTACPGGCEDGACVSDTNQGCSDPDGQDPTVRGTCTDANIEGPFTDFCTVPNASYVVEYSCSGDSCVGHNVFCSPGTKCINGRCILECTDTDGGIDYFEKGTATGTNGTQTDRCFDANIALPVDSCSGACGILEYYCMENEEIGVDTQLSVCTNGCDDGACISGSACSDTDGGNKPYVKGTCSDSNGGHTDYCQDLSTLKEYSCAGDYCDIATVSCSYTGLICVNGACTNPLYTCEDSDNGIDLNIAGTCVDVNGTQYSYHDDYCIDNNTVVDYYCSANYPYECLDNSSLCSLGTSCSNGECVPDTNYHRECNDLEQCITVLGDGVDECSSSLDCTSQPVCGNGICEVEDGYCPEDVWSCEDRICQTALCQDGCNYYFTGAGIADPGLCDATTGCSNPPCVCGGYGNCIADYNVTITGLNDTTWQTFDINGTTFWYRSSTTDLNDDTNTLRDGYCSFSSTDPNTTPTYINGKERIYYNEYIPTEILSFPVNDSYGAVIFEYRMQVRETYNKLYLSYVRQYRP